MAETAGPGNLGNLGNQPSVATQRRPGLVTFAASMMFLLGGFEAMFAILLFAHATWIAINVDGTVGGPLWLWGIIDGLFAVLAFYTGFEILRGTVTGQILGLMIAIFSAVRWFFYIPAAPWTALVIIGVDILIIYGLAAHGEYFRSPQPPAS